MTRPPSALGVLKWPSLLLTLAAPLLAYPDWNPLASPMQRCGTLRTEEGQFALYAGRAADGRMERRYVPIDGAAVDGPLHRLPEGGTFDSGAWRVTSPAPVPCG